MFFFFFSSRRRHTRFDCDWSSDVCSSDLGWRPLRNAGPVLRMENVMRRISAVLILVAATLTAMWVVPPPAHAGRIAPELERRLLVSGPDEFVQVIIRPHGTLLGAALKRQV